MDSSQAQWGALHGQLQTSEVPEQWRSYRLLLSRLRCCQQMAVSYFYCPVPKASRTCRRARNRVSELIPSRRDLEEISAYQDFQLPIYPLDKSFASSFHVQGVEESEPLGAAR
jgi:hypothetical protein